jgi:uncharacterized protein YndB with AHSA1/START domain
MNQAELRLTRVIAAPIEKVFEAWTDPTVMVRWFFAGETWSVEVTSDLREGGAFSLLMHADGGDNFLCSGVYREISPPTRLVFTWTSYAVTDTLVTLELRDLGGATELTLLHEGLVEAAVRQNHADGWGGCLGNLERLLASSVGGSRFE